MDFTSDWGLKVDSLLLDVCCILEQHFGVKVSLNPLYNGHRVAVGQHNLAFVFEDKVFISTHPNSNLLGSPTFKDVSKRKFKYMNNFRLVGINQIKSDTFFKNELLPSFERLKATKDKKDCSKIQAKRSLVNLLKTVGIYTTAELKSVGTIAAFYRIKKVNPQVSHSLLYSISAASSGIPSQMVSPSEKEKLDKECSNYYWHTKN
ncbi:TfoX/Sxy family DNA transformation protein [Vibrio crassostreae]|uniref:TfoX/Sxy family DNA transformation protein n=1 Tax=Vibrio crassostreae TaxID=246167 RepID=UPI001B3030C3|nr:TfoX/Sxy family DNA transformation protein [Vibrio crassostreae]